jgi:hypothetical protein
VERCRTQPDFEGGDWVGKGTSKRIYLCVVYKRKFDYDPPAARYLLAVRGVSVVWTAAKQRGEI